MLNAIMVRQSSWDRGWVYRNRWWIALSVLLLAVVTFFLRWKILALAASICGLLLQGDHPFVVKSGAGWGLQKAGRLLKLNA
jgi:hypothetical protein